MDDLALKNTHNQWAFFLLSFLFRFIRQKVYYWMVSLFWVFYLSTRERFLCDVHKRRKGTNVTRYRRAYKCFFLLRDFRFHLERFVHSTIKKMFFVLTAWGRRNMFLRLFPSFGLGFFFSHYFVSPDNFVSFTKTWAHGTQYLVLDPLLLNDFSYRVRKVPVNDESPSFGYQNSRGVRGKAMGFRLSPIVNLPCRLGFSRTRRLDYTGTNASISFFTTGIS
mmetsp:Transcript_13863/g.15934  ORF Transcript_13863/g.15934 Transcript_13863/m.15934 type:complete len:221 (+) Transcript_13863:44-706(+)